MMNRRAVYIFVFGGLLIFGGLTLYAGWRQGWFSPSMSYSAIFETGEGIYVGTPVSIAGIKAGSVKQVDLNSDNKVVVKISVQSKYAVRIRKDSRAVLGRPFIIGERAVSITPGTNSNPILAENEEIPGEESLEITDMLSGGRLSPYFATFNKLMKQVQVVIEGDGTKDAVTLLDVYKQANRSLVSIEGMAKDFRVLRTDVFASAETRKIIRDFSAASGQLEAVMNETQKALPAITGLSQQVVTVMPQITKTMQETVFTLQAMQRSFILRGGVEKLREEQKSDPNASDRLPASVGKPEKMTPFNGN